MENENFLRVKLAQMFISCGIFGLRDQDLEGLFLRGIVDPQLSELGIDSLAAMELCIAIEDELGVSIVPAQLADLQTLNSLMALIVQTRPET